MQSQAAKVTYPHRYCEVTAPNATGPLVVTFMEDRAEFIDFTRAVEQCFVEALLGKWVREWASEAKLPDQPQP